MVYVKKFLAILCILLLLLTNTSFATQNVSFDQQSAFYYWYTNQSGWMNSILSHLLNIYTSLETNYNDLDGDLLDIYYNTLNTLKVLRNRNTQPVVEVENYILNEQNNLQDIFIYCLQNNTALNDYFKQHTSANVYCYVYETHPNDVVFAIYEDYNQGNTYQSLGTWDVVRHRVITEPGTVYTQDVSTNANIYIFTTTISGNSRVTCDINTHAYTFVPNYNFSGFTIPLCCLGYKSENFRNYLNSIRGVNPTTQAIQDNTQAIKESTDRILSNDEETITGTGVSDSTTDNTPNLQSTFNSMSGAFTTRNTSTKTFVFTLPNGQTYNFTLANNLLTNMLSAYGSTFYAFYQAIFWCVFGGYVLFDFKKIVNKLKGGDIDSVVSNSSPIDSVVKASIS